MEKFKAGKDLINTLSPLLLVLLSRASLSEMLIQLKRIEQNEVVLVFLRAV